MCIFKRLHKTVIIRLKHKRGQIAGSMNNVV